MNKNTEFIFIRHGITELNVKKVYFGQLDPPLINEGIQQIQNTKKNLINENISQEQLDIINRTIENESSIEIIKSVLPSGYLQSRVISFSYQTLQRIVKQRQNHRLAQWRVFVDWATTLPLFTELCLEE